MYDLFECMPLRSFELSVLMREYSTIQFKEIHIRCSREHCESVSRHIQDDRKSLDRYIEKHPLFKESLVSLPLDEEAPPAALEMLKAARLTGIGPMASVAGTLAQRAAEYAVAKTPESPECIVENGGDLFLILRQEALLGLYAGDSPLSGKLALAVPSEMTPLSICSSSRMGHSLSLGKADLVTVCSKNAALADSAATLGGNLIQKAEDLEPTAEKLAAIPGVTGCLIIFKDKLALAGSMPPLVKLTGDLRNKVTRAQGWVITTGKQGESEEQENVG